MRMRLGTLLAGAAVALLLGGCGGGAMHAAATRVSVDGCTVGPHARRVVLRPGLRGVLVGGGRTTFVLTDESDEDLCAWQPFVRALNRHGYAALLYDYLDPTELPAEARAGVRAARAAGARRVVLMGASVGARGSIAAAASDPPGVVAVISLSAERTVASDPVDLVPRARHVTIPTLLVAARDDVFAQGATRPLDRAIAAHRKRALIVSGGDHGTALLTGKHAARVRNAIFAFVAAAG